MNKFCKVLLLSGSLFHNYKGGFSLVLFALVDAKYNFLYVDIGKPGSSNDAKIWHDSSLKKALDDGSLQIPKPAGKVSFHFVGDDIFPLTPLLMKPYARANQLTIEQKVFNYR